MSWVRLDDKFFQHPKILAIPGGAKLLYLCSLTHCAANLTDGHIRHSSLPYIANTVGILPHELDAIVTALLTAGVWRSNAEGYEIHDYLDYNPSAAQLKAERVMNAARQAKWREQRRPQDRETPERNAVTNASPLQRNAVTNASVTDDTSPPLNVPSLLGYNPLKESMEVNVKPSAHAHETRFEQTASLSPVSEASSPQGGNAVTNTLVPESSRPTKRVDPLWDTMLEVCNLPLNGKLTTTERGRLNAALKQLRDIGATATNLRTTGESYRSRWPGIDITPQAIVSNWHVLQTPAPPKSNGPQGHASPGEHNQQIMADYRARRAREQTKGAAP